MRLHPRGQGLGTRNSETTKIVLSSCSGFSQRRVITGGSTEARSFNQFAGKRNNIVTLLLIQDHTKEEICAGELPVDILTLCFAEPIPKPQV